MTLPALPSPQTLATPEQVDAAASQIEEWADQSDDINEVRELQDKWAAITEYIRRKSRKGVARAEAAERHLEVRHGQLDEPKQGQRTDLQPPSHGKEVAALNDRTRTEFRLMAQHADIVDAVIAESTDAQPPSRRRVIGAIRNHKTQQLAAEGRQGLVDAGVKLSDNPTAHAAARRNAEMIAGLMGRLSDVHAYADRFDTDTVAASVAVDRLADSIVDDIESAANWLNDLRTSITNHRKAQS